MRITIANPNIVLILVALISIMPVKRNKKSMTVLL